MKIKRLGVGGYVALSLAALLTALVLFLTLVDWNHFKRPVEHLASAKLGRQVTIAGPLQVKIWSRTPTISVSGLQIANPPWETNDHLVRIGRLLIQLDLAAIFHGHIILRRLEL